MPSAEGIRVSEIADLLEAVRRATKEEKQEFLATLGVKVPRASNRAMAQALVERLPTAEDATLAAVGVWREFATDKERRVLERASSERKGPTRDQRPPCTKPFFLANGRPTRLGEFVLDLITEETTRCAAPVVAVPPEPPFPVSAPQGSEAAAAERNQPTAAGVPSGARRNVYGWIIGEMWKRLRDHGRVKQERLSEADYHQLVHQVLADELQQDASVYSNRSCPPTPYFVDVLVKFKSPFDLPVGIEIKPPGAAYQDLAADLTKLAKMRKRCLWTFGLLLYFRATDLHEKKLLARAEKLRGVYVRRVPVPRLPKSRE